MLYHSTAKQNEINCRAGLGSKHKDKEGKKNAKNLTFCLHLDLLNCSVSRSPCLKE